MSGNDAARLREDERGSAIINDLTLAIMHHYGYTDAHIAEAEAIHPGRICREDECYDEDGESIHPPAYDELHLTANLMAEVVEPYVAPRLDAAEAAQRDRDAVVWEQGWYAGCEDGLDRDGEPVTPNPYRAALASVQQPDEAGGAE